MGRSKRIIALYYNYRFWKCGWSVWLYCTASWLMAGWASVWGEKHGCAP